ncbi:signal peptidase I [Amycolatopsis rhabdoformis]|uniref:Signal peptidase I n=1 Tax=Amycolatopsis rhabdoformis TaxID=1448059 RepID=A0ABZ1IB00_9PSEU|nr:signal peptidase I [Amycolatopsis rhabdoformis]WSE31194.1 signal peptidase I [Amycolatopsis rhabdoformis]
MTDFPPAPAAASRDRRFSPVLAMFLVVLVAGVALAVAGLVEVLSYRVATVREDSMGTTVAPGSAAVYRPSREIHRGDLVILEADALEDNARGVVLKRVIAVAGDEIRCCDLDKRIVLNGKQIVEPYLDPTVSAADAALPFETKVPPASVIVAGDERDNTFDSRVYAKPGVPGGGAIPLSEVDGVVVATGSFFWPDTVEPTTAFTAAGFTGLSTEDTGPITGRLLVAGGVLVFLLGFTGAIVTRVRSARKRRNAAGPPWQ